MAIEAGVPIVPVACSGAHRIMKKKSLVIRPGKSPCDSESQSMFPATPWISATLSRNKFMMRLPLNCPTIRNLQPEQHFQKDRCGKR